MICSDGTLHPAPPLGRSGICFLERNARQCTQQRRVIDTQFGYGVVSAGIVVSIFLQTRQQLRFAQCRQVGRQRGYIARVLQLTEQFRQRYLLARIGTAQLKEPLHQFGFVDGLGHQYIALPVL